MTYRQDNQVKSRRQRSKQAIDLAMQGRWQEAATVNQGLLESFPDDVDAYNRLGRAYMELGEYLQAKGAYERALEIDPYNLIAKKNLSRLAHLGDASSAAGGDAAKVELQDFVGETGKVGVVNLSHLASLEARAKMIAGDTACLKIDGAGLGVENSRGEYLGQVEPEAGQRLIRLMQGGNRYTAAVLSSMEETMTVIIREVSQHPSMAGRLSFPARDAGSMRPHFSDRILRRELQHEEEIEEETGYTVIDSNGAKFVLQPPADIDDGDE